MTYEIERDPLLADQRPWMLARRVEAVLSTLQRFHGAPCRGCAAPLCGHHTLMSLVLGYKDAPRCLPCLARETGRDEATLHAELAGYIASKDCLLTGWRWVRAREPECALGAGHASPPVGAARTPPSADAFDAEWDAGDMGCGDLVLELRGRLLAMEPGRILKVTARDPGAPEDMPAWCSMTGHTLMSAHHPLYFIKRKER